MSCSDLGCRTLPRVPQRFFPTWTPPPTTAQGRTGGKHSPGPTCQPSGCLLGSGTRTPNGSRPHPRTTLACQTQGPRNRLRRPAAPTPCCPPQGPPGARCPGQMTDRLPQELPGGSKEGRAVRAKVLTEPAGSYLAAPSARTPGRSLTLWEGQGRVKKEAWPTRNLTATQTGAPRCLQRCPVGTRALWPNAGPAARPRSWRLPSCAAVAPRGRPTVTRRTGRVLRPGKLSPSLRSKPGPGWPGAVTSEPPAQLSALLSVC